MTWTWFAAVVCAASVLRADPTQSTSGLSGSSFTNELRSGFTRLFQNGVEQPVQSPFIMLQRNPAAEFQTGNPSFQPRPTTPFGGPLAPTFQTPSRPRYEPYLFLSWSYPYQFFPTRFKPSWGGKSRRPNDVLVVVVKTNSKCSANGTNAEGDEADDGDDDDDNDGPNPDDDVEEVTVVVGGTENGKEPSRCVWAILACCAPANTPIRFTCFDMLGCSTAFWNTNPCVPEIIQTALDQATKYYGQGTNDTTTTAPPAGDAAATTAAVTTPLPADASTEAPPAA